MTYFNHEYFKTHPSLRHYVPILRETNEIRSFTANLWENIVEHFFPADQKEKANDVTEVQKNTLINYRIDFYNSSELINQLSKIENDIVNAHRLPYPNNTTVAMDQAIRTDNRNCIAELVAISDSSYQMFKNEIALICETSSPQLLR